MPDFYALKIICVFFKKIFFFLLEFYRYTTLFHDVSRYMANLLCKIVDLYRVAQLFDRACVVETSMGLRQTDRCTITRFPMTHRMCQ